MDRRGIGEHRRADHEDDLAAPSTNLYDEEGPPSVSQDRIELLGEAIWAVYDLRQV